MIRTLISVLVLSYASASIAAPACDTSLTLSCRVIYQAFDGTADDAEASAGFGDENAYEPSLANCASTVYFNAGKTNVRIYATKDVSSGLVSASAMAIQRQGTRTQYSNTASAQATVGMVMNMGSLHLPTLNTPQNTDPNVIKDIYVGCVAK